MTETIGWKFGADIKQEDGHFMPRTCFVAIADLEAARRKLADENPDMAFHSAKGEAVSAADWERAFQTPPADGEVRCDG